MRVSIERLRSEFERILLKLDFDPAKAERVASIFAANSLDGVYTHGLNRFPVFVEYVEDRLVRKDAEPVCIERLGIVERWDGQLGPGVLNASLAMERAVALARQNGLGCVAMRNTNHWMRGGTYGWQAADAGMIGICFTNTIANIPPWGGTKSRLGNNPLVIAVPRSAGHVVLDMAMSQFSFGKISQYRSRGEELPFDGGYDAEGNLTKDPAAVMETMRGLPIGFWKGSGLALMLDILAAVLSKGRTTADITGAGKEYGVSQVFIAIDPGDTSMCADLTNKILAYTRSSGARPGETIAYPGQHTLRTREANKTSGIPVDEEIWDYICSKFNK